MTREYCSYGLRVLADGEIPGLAPTSFLPVADVRVWLNKMPAGDRSGECKVWYQSDRLNPRGRPNLTIWRTPSEGAFHFKYDDETEFLIHPDGSQVWCTWPDGATVADAAVYLRGPVLGLVLRLRGIVCLHASAIAVGESAIAMLGAPGAGKSTTAAGFVKLGFSLLADDLVALNADGRKFRVLAGCPRLNLWPDAGETLYGSADALPRVTPSDGINEWWDKRYRDLEPGREFHPDPLPLAAIYVLGDRTSDAGAPSVEPLSARDAFMTLTDGTYVNYALDTSMRATEFRTLAELVRAIPIRLVTPHNSPDRLLDLCAAILSDYSELTSRPLAAC